MLTPEINEIISKICTFIVFSTLIIGFFVCIFVLIINFLHRRKAKKLFMNKYAAKFNPRYKSYANTETGERVYDTFTYICIDTKSGKETKHEYIIKEY